MQKGTIRKRGTHQAIGHWRADVQSIVVETEDPDLKRAADEILRTSQTIPVHASERFEFATQAEPVTEPPSRIKYLALFALELEERGFELDPGEE
ncbi:MAG: hypothetical protein ACHQ7N_02920 [Candidatus Methylomirabilales bacterium]